MSISVVTALTGLQAEMAEKRHAIAATERTIEQHRRELGTLPGALYDAKAHLRLAGEDERRRAGLEAEIASLTARIAELTQELRELEQEILPRLQREREAQEHALQRRRHDAHVRSALDPSVSAEAMSGVDRDVIEAALLSDEEFVRQWNAVVSTVWQMTQALGYWNGFRAQHDSLLRTSARELHSELPALLQPLPTTEGLLVQLRDGIVPTYHRALRDGEHTANQQQLQAYAATPMDSGAVSSSIEPEAIPHHRQAETHPIKREAATAGMPSA
jgi:hypothetical protein